MADDQTGFYIAIDSDVVAAAKAAATLHGIDIESVVEEIVTNTLTQYAEKVRKAVPKPESVGLPQLPEDDIPF